MKLASKIILTFIVAVIGVTAISSYLTSRQLFEVLESRHRSIADGVVKRMRDAIQAQGDGQMERFSIEKWVESVPAGEAQVRWVWMEETISQTDALNELTMNERTIRTIRQQKMASFATESNDGRRELHTYCAVNLPHERQGALEITSPLDEVDRQMRFAWWTTLGSIGTIGLLSIGVVMVAGVRWIARPLGQLTDKMERIGQGDFASDLEIGGNDELAELGAAVNRMCDQLRDQQQTIETETNQRVEAITQLRHADRLKTVGQLAAGFAHEVGTPLSVVSGRASLLASSSQLTQEQVQSNARTIKTECDRISQIVRQLLDFARQGNPRKSSGDLRDVIDRSVELMRPLARKRGVEIDLRLPEEPAPATMDHNQIQQVMMNLIDNAIDSSEIGQTVVVKLTASLARWRVSVEDHGSGIPREDQPRIFEPFFTTKQVGDGTGLGLSIAHGIIDEHGGNIQLHSEVEQGTQVLIELPREADTGRLGEAKSGRGRDGRDRDEDA